LLHKRPRERSYLCVSVSVSTRVFDILSNQPDKIGLAGTVFVVSLLFISKSVILGVFGISLTDEFSGTPKIPVRLYPK
jgi:hypothetical protein